VNLELGKLGDFNSEPPTLSGTWRKPQSTIRVQFITGLIAIDTVCIAASFKLAFQLLAFRTEQNQWLYDLAGIVPIYYVIAANQGAFSPSQTGTTRAAVRLGAQSFMMTIGAVALVAFSVKVSDTFSRVMLATGSVFSFVSLSFARYAFVSYTRNVLGIRPYNTVLLTDTEQNIPYGDYSVLVMTPDHFDPDKHDPDMYDRLAQSLGHADRVIVSCLPERRERWAHALKGANIQSEIFAPELLGIAPLGLSWQDDVPTIVVAKGPLPLSARVVKRTFDLCATLLALPLLMPLMLVVAALIKLDSPGPVFFKQTRIGRGNKKFAVMKFRSMTVEQSDATGHTSTKRDDNRITRIGRILRKTSIDELPQLFNVLKGDMSIVGPRPHALGSRAADKLFWEVDERYWYRHAAKPGLTGLAQVRGYRGATVFEDDLTNRLQADLEYLDHWSILKDMWIILLTTRVIFHRNAF
jgi:exopolysaccharide biosynthesis polyprenyl glycosylphosphotransferase